MTPPAPPAPRTVVVCDDSRHLRDAVTTLLGDQPRFQVVGQAVDGNTCLQLLAATRPDILILDVRMPGGGAHLVRAARTACPSMRIVMHSGHSDPLLQQEMLDSGADAYVVKSGRLSRLIMALDGPAHVVSEAARDLAHTAHFLRNDREWTAECCRFVRAALADDGRLIVAATSAHRAALQAALPDAIGLADDQGRVLIYSAEQTMPLLIPNGQVDAGYFRHELKPAIEDFMVGPGGVAFWGEMVGLTWGTGNVAAALELETLWNTMLVESPMTVRCPYPGSADRPVSVADVAAVRCAHSHTDGLLIA